MIYVDTSVALGELLADDRRPAESFWNETLDSRQARAAKAMGIALYDLDAHGK
jgi:hypothetical protein